MTEEMNTLTDRQELRRWCLELAATEPTREHYNGACTRQIVATAATYEDFILNGAQSKELDALLTKVESAWNTLARNARARAREGLPETAKDVQHLSSCALHNPPAFAPGPCDCGALYKAMDGALDRLTEVACAVHEQLRP